MFLPPKNNLVFSGEPIRCRKVRQIILYHVSNKILSPEKNSHHVLFLFYPFRVEKELLSGFPPLHQNKLQEQGFQDVLKTDKIKFKPYGDLVDQACSKCIETLINNQDPHSQLENHETPGAEYPNKNDPENTDTHTQKILQSSTLCPKYQETMKSQKV